MLLTGWELFTGAGTAEDDARVGLLLAIARRLTDAIMLMVARQRRGEGDERPSPLIMPALAVGEALTGLLDARRTNPAARTNNHAASCSASSSNSGAWPTSLRR